MEPTVVLISHFQLTARFDFVSLSLHSMHPTYTQTHKHTIKTYKLIGKHIDNICKHADNKYINTLRSKHVYIQTHMYSDSRSLRQTHIYINTHM